MKRRISNLKKIIIERVSSLTNQSRTLGLACYIVPPLVAILLLLPSIDTALVADDYYNVTARGLAPGDIINDLRQGGAYGARNYRPMEGISYRIDNFIWGESPWTYRLTNLAFHVLSVILVISIAWMVARSVSVSILAGIFFAIHPVAVPAVIWISGRTTGLLTFSLLLTTWLYLKFREEGKWRYLILSLAVYAASLLTKEQSYLFPVILLLLHLGTPGRDSLDISVSPRTLFAGSAAILLLAFAYMVIQTSGPGITGGGISPESGAGLAFLWLMLFFIFLLVLGAITRTHPGAIFLIGYVIVEAIIVFGLILPSGGLTVDRGYLVDPMSFSAQRLADDIFVLLTTIGIYDFSVRDALRVFSASHYGYIAALWLLAGVVLIAPLFLWRRNTTAIVAWLGCYLFAIATMRTLPTNFLTVNNLYLAAPVVALAIGYGLRFLWRRNELAATVIGVGGAVMFVAGSLSWQLGHQETGRFSQQLHALFTGESKDQPGPLRLVLNIPDPLGMDVSHFLVYRVVASAMHLGGYSNKKVDFVERRVVQIVAIDQPGCNYDIVDVQPESLAIKVEGSSRHAQKCQRQLKFLDFHKDDDDVKSASFRVTRRSDLQGNPLTSADMYWWDGNFLKQVILPPTSH